VIAWIILYFHYAEIVFTFSTHAMKFEKQTQQIPHKPAINTPAQTHSTHQPQITIALRR
jgi:hypothetical protein